MAAGANKRHRSTNLPRRKARLGQNFLTDASAAQRIVNALGDISQGTVLEIGPGRGAITQLLSERAKRLIAIELDRTLAAQLRMAYARNPQVEIIEADVLRVDFAALLEAAHPRVAGTLPQVKPEPARVVGNLPYYITSDILLKLFAAHQDFKLLVIMVQKEVADRISASPGSRDYGLLTATTQLFAEVENLFTLPPQAFSPPPKVHSSVLRLRIAPRAQELGVQTVPFVGFLRSVFAQKRKTLLNNLKTGFDEARARAAIQAAGLRPDVRAEAVPLESMARIFKHLSTE